MKMLRLPVKRSSVKPVTHPAQREQKNANLVAGQGLVARPPSSTRLQCWVIGTSTPSDQAVAVTLLKAYSFRKRYPCKMQAHAILGGTLKP